MLPGQKRTGMNPPIAAYCDIVAASDRTGGLSARNLLYSTGRNPRCHTRLHFGTVLYRQPLRRTTLKTPLGIPASPVDDVGCPGTQTRPAAAARSKAWRGNAFRDQVEGAAARCHRPGPELMFHNEIMASPQK